MRKGFEAMGAVRERVAEAERRQTRDEFLRDVAIWSAKKK